MNQDSHYDLIIIGAGSAGTQAAIDAAKQGKKTALIESGFIGGTCLNSGCVPTKFLLCNTAAKPIMAAQEALGALSGHIDFSLSKIQEIKSAYLANARITLEKELAKAGVIYLKGKAQFSGPQALTVNLHSQEVTLTFTKCIVATGSTPAAFPNLKADGKRVIGSSSAINLKEVPKSLILVGGGPIGLELGEFFYRLGTKITLIDKAPRLLAMEDPDISSTMLTHLTASGWDIHLDKNIASVSTQGESAVLTLDTGESFTANYALVAIGRRPNLAGLAPEKANIPLKPNGFIETNPYLQATEHIYAAGDITAKLMLANAAVDQAKYVVRHLMGNETTPYTPPFIPSCVYGSLECMRVGPTVTDLLKTGKTITTTKVPLTVNHIANAYASTTGFVKMAFCNNELQSVAAIGASVSELISYAAMLVANKTQKIDFTIPLTASPTFSEILLSALLADQIVAS